MKSTSSSAAGADAPSVLSPTAVKPDTTAVAIWLVVASTVFFSAGDVAAKLLTETLPAAEVAWLRYLIFALLAVPAALAIGGRRAIVTARPKQQAVRGIAVVASSLFFIMALGQLDVSEATAINFISPIFMMALSIPMLGEKVGARRWSAAGVSFVGVVLVVQPGTDAFTLAALLPMASALCWAFSGIVTRAMGDERAETTLAWSSMLGLVLLSASLPFSWVTPTLPEIGIAVLMGVFSTAGNWLVVLAFRLAPASVLAPFFYLQLVSAAAFSFLMFNVVPGQWTVVGGAVIAASGLYVAHRERIRKREAMLAAAAVR